LKNGALPRAVGELRAVADDNSVAISPQIGMDEVPELRCVVDGEHYRFAVDSFFQVNRAMLSPLITEALRYADPVDATGRPVAIDLYCGVGLFTLPLARRYRRVIGVEEDAIATGFASRNLSDGELKNARVVTAHVEDWLATQARQLAPVAFALLDPPRTGAAGATLAGLLALRPHRISYVSCDPATLARDLRTLLSRDYRLHALAALDMVPQTHHVEVVAHLVRE
jgi:23S rRNA (uracil1939-C5)-methyltransferase